MLRTGLIRRQLAKPGVQVNLERRQEFRHVLNRQANFAWTDDKGVEYAAHGLTRDISPQGMFIYTDFPPPPSAILKIEVVLSDANSPIKIPLRMKTSASVIRVEPPLEPGLLGGFAAVNKTFELVRDSAAVLEEGLDYWKQ